MSNTHPRSVSTIGRARKRFLINLISYGSLPQSVVEWLMLGDSTAVTPFLPRTP
jgi:hypothetical protein